MTPWMMVMMTIIVALIISLFLVQKDCPFIAVIGGRADIIDRKYCSKKNFSPFLALHSINLLTRVKQQTQINFQWLVTKNIYSTINFRYAGFDPSHVMHLHVASGVQYLPFPGDQKGHHPRGPYCQCQEVHARTHDRNHEEASTSTYCFTSTLRSLKNSIAQN